MMVAAAEAHADDVGRALASDAQILADIGTPYFYPVAPLPMARALPLSPSPQRRSPGPGSSSLALKMPGPVAVASAPLPSTYATTARAPAATAPPTAARSLADVQDDVVSAATVPLAVPESPTDPVACLTPRTLSH